MWPVSGRWSDSPSRPMGPERPGKHVEEQPCEAASPWHFERLLLRRVLPRLLEQERPRHRRGGGVRQNLALTPARGRLIGAPRLSRLARCALVSPPAGPPFPYLGLKAGEEEPLNPEPEMQHPSTSDTAVGLLTRIATAQSELASQVTTPDDRERVMSSLVTGLEQLNELLGRFSAVDMGLIGAAATVVQGERQIRAIEEQTSTLNAGQFAMWRQTMEGRTYLAWESAASTLLRSMAQRDRMVSDALDQDLTSDEYRRPPKVPLQRAPKAVAKPEMSAYRVKEPPGWLLSLAGFSVLWLVVEVVIGWFGAAGLLNNWLVLGIVVALAFAGELFGSWTVRPQYAQDMAAYEKYRAESADVRAENARLQAEAEEAEAAWSARLHAGFGVRPDSPVVEWMADPRARQSLETVRRTLSEGRGTFPSPESLPALVLPDAKLAAGGDPDAYVNRLLHRFAESVA